MLVNFDILAWSASVSYDMWTVKDGDIYHIEGLVQERHNSSALAMELRLSCTNPSICKDSQEIMSII